MAQMTRTQIQSVLIVGTLLYLLLAPIAYYVGEVREPVYYVPFLVLTVMNSVSVYFLRTRHWDGEVPSFLLVASCSGALSHAYFFYPALSGSVFHAVMAFGMFNAMVDVSTVLRRRASITMLAFTAVATVGALLTTPGFAGPVVAGPVVVVFLWKVLLFVRFRESQALREKTRQMEAFRATVVTLNHEFNNVSAICQTLLRKIRGSAAPAVITEAEDLDMLERNLERMVKSIKALRKIESYEEVVYVGSTKMVDLAGTKK